jgi:hypothetical protein
MGEKRISSKKISKKQARKLIYVKLAAALAEYKSTIKEKRFVTKLKKVSKLFANDFAKSVNKANKQSSGSGKKPVKVTTGYAHQSIIG